MVKEGDKAPDFRLLSDSGSFVTLSEFKGRKVVLYFYPKDDTPGCTKEACSFRDMNSLFLEKGAAVVGVSADNRESHLNFRSKYNLPFYLLSDPDHKVMETYGAWEGKTIRSTFIIDENGNIIKVFPKVIPESHADEVLKYL